MAFTETAAQLSKAAQRHMADAYRLLGDEPRHCSCRACSAHRLGAMYLAGYAIECALKALAIRRRGKATWDEVVGEEEGKGRRRLRLRGAAGHSLTTLLGAADLDVTAAPGAIRSRWEVLTNRWSVELRYAGRTPSSANAKALVFASSDVHEWILGQPA